MARRARFEVYENKGGEFAWRFKASNSRVIASGEGYKRHADCLRAIDILREQAADADLKDSTVTQEPTNPSEPLPTRTLYVVVEVTASLRRGVATYETREMADNDAASRQSGPGLSYEVEEATETEIA